MRPVGTPTYFPARVTQQYTGSFNRSTRLAGSVRDHAIDVSFATSASLIDTSHPGQNIDLRHPVTDATSLETTYTRTTKRREGAQ